MKGLVIRNLFFQKTGPINLRVNPEECIGITGPSGVGKSLFLRAVTDMDYHTGSISLDGMNSSDMPAHQWRKKVGLLSAESYWWFDTIGQHFISSNADNFLEALGFDQNVFGWKISRMSSGERQRIAIARLLANNPEALLLDEPTANLDEENIFRVEAIIKKYQAYNHLPVIWVSHDKAQIQRISSRRFNMDNDGLWEI